MTKKIHLPTFLFASFCAILGLWIENIDPQASATSIIILFVGLGAYVNLIYRMVKKNDKK